MDKNWMQIELQLLYQGYRAVTNVLIVEKQPVFESWFVQDFNCHYMFKIKMASQ